MAKQLKPTNITLSDEDRHAVSFTEFLFIWNRLQGQSTPYLHHQIADWLDKAVRNQEPKLLLMAFRAAGKSTLTGLFITWRLWQMPELRILILSAEQELANRMIRSVRRVIERHPFTTMLKPDRLEEWAADRLTVRRFGAHRDPSLLARGVEANLTGSRADMIILDDIEVPNNCDTALKREQLRTRLTEVDYILVPGGMQLYIGTPHSYYSIYAEEPRKELGESVAFLRGFKRLSLPILTDQGESQWPERYSLEEIEQIRLRHGPTKFTSQMLLKPISEHALRLDPERMVPYHEELRYHEGNHETSLWLGETQLVSASCMWDPAYGDPYAHNHNGTYNGGGAGAGTRGASGGDDSTIALVYTDRQGRYFVHRVEVLQIEEGNSLDPARQQCRQVALFLERYYIPTVRIEGNGIGRFLPRLLANVLEEMGIEANVITCMNRQSKVKRILNAFDAPLAAGQIYAHQNVLSGPLTLQMSEWRADGLQRGSHHDDALDAVAGAILAEPVRLPRHFNRAAPIKHKQYDRTSWHNASWKRGVYPVTLKQKFDPFNS